MTVESEGQCRKGVRQGEASQVTRRSFTRLSSSHGIPATTILDRTGMIR
jgi:hypothetical protein